MDAICTKLANATPKQLDALFLGAAPPTPGEGFPLRGCSYGCLSGSNGVGATARLPQARRAGGDGPPPRRPAARPPSPPPPRPRRRRRARRRQVNMGWSGKCFNFDINATTGTPTSLLNAFAPMYMYPCNTQAVRVNGSMTGFADVYWDRTSHSDGRPVWTFNYARAGPLQHPADAYVEVKGIRDEVRLIAPGFMLGRMYVMKKGEGFYMPLYFALFQACTASGQFPTKPQARALPPLAGVRPRDASRRPAAGCVTNVDLRSGPFPVQHAVRPLDPLGTRSSRANG
ncbi:hypothetical protein HT031_000674 [Scenedesmus sp. PABB004]|nr:hypothetical protein HT031_000674 [Scenedesmus sp. PABB004]